MNWDQIKKNVGHRVKLVPQAYHLDGAGDPLPFRDEDWIIMSVTNEYAEISAPSGHFYRLGRDHIFSFASDHQRGGDGLKHGFLQLKLQLYIQGADVRALPNHIPGAPVVPPVNLALKARSAFIPDIERVFRRLVHILDRTMVNYSTAAGDLLGKPHAIRPNDTWESLRPTHSRLYPDSALLRDLSAGDSQMLAEFFSAVGEVDDLINHWAGTVPLTEYNAWNVLMHRVENSLSLGERIVRKFSPDRPYDATMPAGGTLLTRAQRSLQMATGARRSFMDRMNAARLAKPAPAPPRRRR